MTQNSKQTNIFFNTNLLESKYFPFAIPAIYFIAMFIVVLTNRLIGDYGVETDFYVAYVEQAKEFLNGNIIVDQYRGPVYQIVLGIIGGLINSDFYLAGKIINVIAASVSLFFVCKIISKLLSNDKLKPVRIFIRS